MEVVIKKRFRIWPRKRRWQVTISIALAILFVAIVTVGYLFWLLNKSVPQTEGTIEVSGLIEEVNVYRDEAGTPHIEAKNQHDLFFAQGYVTAQDRIFQMDLSRRQASGMLSEVVGKQALDRDKFFRTLGLRRAAEKSLDLYSDEARKALESYAEGVNQYIKQAKAANTLPIEFTIMGYEPEEWSDLDSITIGKYMAFDLGGHWEGQAFRHHLIQNFPEDKALELFPSYPEDGLAIIQAVKDSTIDIGKSFAGAVIPHEFNGSNNWVVSGERSESGFPLLADDPHLGLATPAIWYETHLQSPEINVSGVIFAGIPGIILGRNETISWGVTNVGPDVQDLYIEKRNPDNKHEFLYNDKWEPAEIIAEKIFIKDEEPLDHEVVVTRHGPIMSEFAHYEDANTALAMKWTALEPSTELEAVLKFSKATNWEEFKEALTYFHTPAQNFVFASTDGTIAYRANGLIPIRKKGDSLLPVPGWTDEYEWEGYIPWEELPTVVNPAEGYIATANYKIAGEEYPYHISNIWAQPYRQQRIQDVLESKEKLNVEDMMQLQFDHYNLQAEEFVPILLKNTDVSNLREIDREALETFEDWDFTDSTDLAAPLLFHFWMEEIANVLFHDEISEDVLKLFAGKGNVVDQLIREAHQGKEGIWITENGGLQKVLQESLTNAVNRASNFQGENPAEWKWGEVHAAEFSHPLSTVNPLHLLFNRKGSIPMRGSRVTVGAAGWNSETGKVNHGAAWRTIVDMKNPLESYNVVGPGQSGHVMSPWYHDQMDDWTQGRYHQTLMSDEYREEAKSLVLQPK
ncbi:penicillin acylase family protein [Sutcliffiella horikoshii]|uniref:Penicillin acylase family protein n=1 Tax=Sutcliffiella horikoshii TaxID=79883 RepID=A0A5D4T4Q4_9BACI|nr:penicillin acylase family protein [Sutcliffiella horikoshii]TYS69462.1 penicillin acylase family protein [Sutcliffiella horikoshii]